MSAPGSTADTPTDEIGTGATVADGSPGTVAETTPAGDDAAERGRLDISFGVVRRIAEHAADRTDATARTRRRLMGVGREAGTTAKVSGYGGSVDLRLEVPLAYPTPIGPAVDSVRDEVRERVQTLTGYVVRSLDVTVSALTAPASPTSTSRAE